MESEFEPVVRTEETSEGRVVEIDLPGFRIEDLKVQVNNRGSVIISGERSVKETDGMRKVGGSLKKMQSGGHRFRKVISVPENLNLDGITAKFRDERLRVSLPLRNISEQQNEDELPGSGKPDQSLESTVDRLSPAGKQESMKKQRAQDDQSAGHPEGIRQEDDTSKPTVAAEESNELLAEKKTEAPKQAEDLAGEPPISTHAQTICHEQTGSAHPPESLQSKSKQDDATVQQEDGGQKSGKLPECRYPPQEKKEKACTEDRKPAEKSDHVFWKEGIGEDIGNVIRHQQEGKKVDKSCPFWRTDQFPFQKRIQIPASCSSTISTISKRGVLIASTVLVLSVGFYITYRSRSRHRI